MVSNAPPLSRDEWEQLVRFDQEVRKVHGAGVIDIETIAKINLMHRDPARFAPLYRPEFGEKNTSSSTDESSSSQ